VPARDYRGVGVTDRLHDPELSSLRSGDEQAFQSLVARLHGPMLRLVMGYVRDREIAEDVVQESWLTVLKNLDQFEERSTLKTWILGIALNIARSRRRKERRVLPFSSLWRGSDREESGPTVDPSRFDATGTWREKPDSWSNVPESRLLSQETMQRVREAVDTLPPMQREVLVLRDVAGMDSGEVCGMLGITAENQRVRLHRARTAVRKMLEEYLR
jgi:RNA polymerase sigma-70 factor, ECF subfamily